MKQISIIILLLLTIVPCFAYNNDYNRIELFADSINSNIYYNNNQTIQSYVISNWVETSIKYKFYFKARGITKTWQTLEGDCTDKAMLKQYMLKHIGVKTRLVHGYDYFGNKHDTLEYWYNNKWNQHEYGFIKKGNNIW